MTTRKSKRGRGGARPGAGRPATTGTDPSLTFRAPAELIARVRADAEANDEGVGSWMRDAAEAKLARKRSPTR